MKLFASLKMEHHTEKLKIYATCNMENFSGIVLTSSNKTVLVLTELLEVCLLEISSNSANLYSFLVKKSA